jgi:hypothetical protein
MSLGKIAIKFNTPTCNYKSATFPKFAEY